MLRKKEDIDNFRIDERYFRSEIAKDNLDGKFLFPAHLRPAQYHAAANMMNRIEPASLIGRQDNCPCCGKIKVEDKFELCHSTFINEQQGRLLRTHIPLTAVTYFSFIRAVALFLVLRVLIVDTYTAVQSIYGQYCYNLYLNGAPNLCSFTLSGFNLNAAANQSALQVIDLLNLAYALVAILMFLKYRIILNEEREKYISYPFLRTRSYSLLLEGIPSFMGKAHIEHYEHALENELQKIIKKWLQTISEAHDSDPTLTYLDKQVRQDLLGLKPGEKLSDEQWRKKKQWISKIANISVSAVTICYDTTEIENIESMRQEQKLKHIRLHEGKLQENPEQIPRYTPEKIQHLNYQQVTLSKQFLQKDSVNPGFKRTHFTGKAIVTFQYTHFRNYFRHRFEEDRDFFKVGEQSVEGVQISLASDPEDIYWFSMRVSEQDRHKHILYSWGILFMLLAISFVAFYGLLIWQNTINAQQNVAPAPGQNQPAPNKALNVLLLILQSGLTFIINQILAFVIDKLSWFSKPKTLSSRMLTSLVMTVVTQTINTCFIYGLVYLFDPVNPLSRGRLVSKINSLVLTNAFLNLITSVFIPSNIVSYFVNCKWKIKATNNNMFQSDLNALLEAPTFDLIKAYTYYILMAFLVSFYGFLTPLSSIAQVILLGCQYWVDKWNMFHRYSKPIDPDEEFEELVLSILEVSILLSAAGHLLWDLAVHYDSSLVFQLLNILTLLICLIFVGFAFLAPRSFKNRVLRIDQTNSQISFSDYWKFEVNENCKTYFSENPATSCFSSPEILFSGLNQRSISSNIPKYFLEVLARKEMEKKKSLNAWKQIIAPFQEKIDAARKEAQDNLTRLNVQKQANQKDIAHQDAKRKCKKESLNRFLQRKKEDWQQEQNRKNPKKVLRSSELMNITSQQEYLGYQEIYQQLIEAERELLKVTSMQFRITFSQIETNRKLQELDIQQKRLDMIEEYCKWIQDKTNSEKVGKDKLIEQTCNKERQIRMNRLLQQGMRAEDIVKGIERRICQMKTNNRILAQQDDANEQNLLQILKQITKKDQILLQNKDYYEPQKSFKYVKVHDNQLNSFNQIDEIYSNLFVI